MIIQADLNLGRLQASPSAWTFIILLLQQPKFLLLQHEGLRNCCLDYDKDRMLFVSVNGSNVFDIIA